MATPRKRWVKQPTSIIREPWPRDVKVTALMLSCWLGDRWARDGLSWEEASTARLSLASLAQITGMSRTYASLSVLGKLSSLASVAVQPVNLKPCVYFVRSRDRVKVGSSLDPDRRLSQLRREHGSAEMLGVAVTLDYAGMERRIHQRLAEYRVEGEWFCMNDAPGVLEGCMDDTMASLRSGEGVSPVRDSGVAGVVISWPKWAELQRPDSRSEGNPGVQSSPRASPSKTQTQTKTKKGSPQLELVEKKDQTQIELMTRDDLLRVFEKQTLSEEKYVGYVASAIGQQLQATIRTYRSRGEFELRWQHLRRWHFDALPRMLQAGRQGGHAVFKNWFTRLRAGELLNAAQTWDSERAALLSSESAAASGVASKEYDRAVAAGEVEDVGEVSVQIIGGGKFSLNELADEG